MRLRYLVVVQLGGWLVLLGRSAAAERAVFAMLVRRLPVWLRKHRLVCPGNVLRWHRRLVAKMWTYPNQAGRPPIDDTVVALIERMARENAGWPHTPASADTALADSGC